MPETEAVPPPPTPRPFESQPRSTPGGCGTPMLVGCGIAAILLGLGAILFVVKAKSLLAYTMVKLQEQVVANLPADATPGASDRLAAAFTAAVDRVRGGELDPVLLQAMQAKLVAAAEKAPRGALTATDVAELTAALERFAAGREAPEPPAEATPAAAATP